MRTLIAAMVLGAALALAGPAPASNCPVVIKQGRDAAAKLNAGDAKLHDSGKHSESLQSANEALDLLGVKK